MKFLIVAALLPLLGALPAQGQSPQCFCLQDEEENTVRSCVERKRGYKAAVFCYDPAKKERVRVADLPLPSFLTPIEAGKTGCTRCDASDFGPVRGRPGPVRGNDE